MNRLQIKSLAAALASNGDFRMSSGNPRVIVDGEDDFDIAYLYRSLDADPAVFSKETLMMIIGRFCAPDEKGTVIWAEIIGDEEFALRIQANPPDVMEADVVREFRRKAVQKQDRDAELTRVLIQDKTIQGMVARMFLSGAHA